MKVTVIDCSVSGHRETYYKQFAQTWAGMGHETSLIAPDGKGVQETVAFQPVSALPLLPLPAGKPLQKKLVVLRNAVIRLRNLYRLRRSLQRLKPDLVFFACLDDMLPTLAPLWLFNLLLPYQWSGLLVQSALPPYHRGMPDTSPFPAKQELRRSRHTERIFSERPGNISAPHSAVSRLCRSFGSPPQTTRCCGN